MKLTTLPVAAMALISASVALAQNPHMFPSGSASPSSQGPTTPTMSADESAGPAKGGVGKAAPAAKGPNDKSKDTVFLKQAAAGGMKEVAMLEQAQKNGQSGDVKNIAGKMLSDHRQLNSEVTKLAREEHVQLGGRPQLPDMKGSTFDKDFLHMLVEAHNNDIALFNGEAKNGQDPDVKALAQKALPTLREHLKMAKAAQQKVGTTDSTQPR